MPKLLKDCATPICTITAVNSLGKSCDFVLDGIRDISMVNGEFSKAMYNEIFSSLTEAHMAYESAVSDPDGDYELGMSQARRILRKFMKRSYIKYVLTHAANDPKNLNTFIVLCNHGISCSLLLQKVEVSAHGC